MRLPVLKLTKKRVALAGLLATALGFPSTAIAEIEPLTVQPATSVTIADGVEDDTTNWIEQTQFISTTLLPPLLQANPFRTAPAPLIPGIARRDALLRQLETAPRQRRRRRLSRVPSMFGDFFFPTATVFSNSQATIINGQTTTAQIPVAGGSARTKIGEYNKAVPVDRIYANWNHYHNAIERRSVDDTGTVANETASFDRFTLGFERTLFNGDYSVEMRLPLSLYPDLNTGVNAFGATLAADTGNIGNLSIIGKAVLLEFEDSVYSAGLGIEVPTGSDGFVTSSDSRVELQNEAVFLHPFLAYTEKNDDWFMNAFVQLDLPLNGNTLTVSDETGFDPAFEAGKVDPQSLFHFDVSLGRWLMRDTTGKTSGLTGVAALLEYHFVNTLQDADTVGYAQNNIGLGPVTGSVGQGANHITSMNLTAGVHLEFANNFMVRAATVHPLRTGDDRLFDSEFMLQIGRRF